MKNTIAVPKQTTVLYADLDILPEDLRSMFQTIRIQWDTLLSKLNIQFFTGLDDAIRVYTADKMMILAPQQMDQGTVLDVFNLCIHDLQMKNRDDRSHWIHGF